MVSIKNIALAAAAVTGALAQTDSICDKYTKALLTNNTAANQYTLVTLIVKTVALGNFTGNGTKLPSLPGSLVNVPGLLKNGTVNGTAVNLAPYFNGMYKSTNVNDTASSVNFLDLNATTAVTNATYVGEPSSKAYRLITHLTQYFGSALGCSTYGQEGFPAYAGKASQYSVHKYMAISNADNTYFIQQVGLAAESFGASAADATTVGTLLNNLFNYRCSPNTTVIAAQGPQLQAICQDVASCPLSPNATCSAYPTNGYTAFAQIQTANSTMTSSGSSSSKTPVVVVTTNSAGMTVTTTSTPTGGAVATVLPGVMAAVGAVAAMIL